MSFTHAADRAPGVYGASVRDLCLGAALEQPVTLDQGIWGGTSAQQRQSLRREAA
ncbi:MAG: hypothetical protein Q8K58_10790 [Acidimicrobiales bacterium]|nr:hypothetical protein [Acidimicrobiales bacterium]